MYVYITLEDSAVRLQLLLRKEKKAFQLATSYNTNSTTLRLLKFYKNTYTYVCDLFTYM